MYNKTEGSSDLDPRRNYLYIWTFAHKLVQWSISSQILFLGLILFNVAIKCILKTYSHANMLLSILVTELAIATALHSEKKE